MVRAADVVFLRALYQGSVGGWRCACVVRLNRLQDQIPARNALGLDKRLTSPQMLPKGAALGGGIRWLWPCPDCVI
jgi:hypothetical protein